MERGASEREVWGEGAKMSKTPSAQFEWKAKQQFQSQRATLAQQNESVEVRPGRGWNSPPLEREVGNGRSWF